ncbi:hypothetical protein TrispH2_002106 [Trichoplax sp. H2]|nr:hypothetical protein TrispH2_002106 [Trichoplax sp. H2]|eukprot:RDD45750.1 hypothetical protein TrispH2_002106 [Trichoplax sp. H2]
MAKRNLLIIVIALIGCSVNGLQNNYQREINNSHELLKHLVNYLAELKGVNLVERSEYLHHIKQREIQSTPSKIWLDGSLTSCVNVGVNISSFCNINYKVPEYLVKTLTLTLEFVAKSYEVLRPRLHTDCFAAIREIVCKGTLPKCSLDGTATYLNFSSSCSHLNSTCLPNIIHINGQSGSTLCSEAGKQYTLNACRKPKLTAINKDHCSPFSNGITYPTWLMASLAIQEATVKNTKTSFERRNVSTDCINKWVKFTCNRIPFCSLDQTSLHVGVSKQQCEEALTCLPPSMAATRRAGMDCNSFPDSNNAVVVSSSYSILAINYINLFLAYLFTLLLF